MIVRGKRSLRGKCIIEAGKGNADELKLRIED